jgi:phage-related minor tail protein
MTLGMLVSGIGAVITIIGAITAPIWIAIGVIAALIAVVVLLYFAWKNNWWGIREVTASVVDYLKNLWQSFLSWFQQLTSGQLGVWSTLWRNTWTAIKAIVDGALRNLQLIMQAFRFARQGDWYAFGATLRMIWENNWMTMKVVLSNILGSIGALLHTTVTNIMNWWRGIDWQSLGRNIGQGILNGLNNMGSALYQAIRRIAQNMLYTFQGFFGINSPSKVMEDQFAYLAQGAMIGWDTTFEFSPQAINAQMMSTYSTPTVSGGGENTRVVSLLEQLNNKDTRIDEGVLVRAFRDAVLLMRD